MGFEDNWKYLGIGSICCIGIILLAVIFGFGSSDVNTSSDTNDPFHGNDARLENVSITSSYGYFNVDGKIMFKNDEYYADLAADVNLKDGSKISESIVHNWNNVKKDQWYKFDSMLLSTSGNSYSLSEIKSVDFKYNDNIIYTWQKE